MATEIKTTTASGVEITLKPTLNAICGDTVVNFTATIQGQNCRGRIRGWSEKKSAADAEVWGLKINGKAVNSIGIQIPKADFDAAFEAADLLKVEAEQAKEDEKQQIEAGEKQITVNYRDGEYLSGWGVGGPAAALLVKIGAAEHVSSWGTIVDRKVIENLGESFTYPQVLELYRSEIEEKEKKKAEKVESRAKAIEEAKRRAVEAGEPVKLSSWSEPCDGSVCECDQDIVFEMIDADGNISHDRVHMH